MNKYSTDQLTLAAFLSVITNINPECRRDIKDKSKIIFLFPETEEIRKLVESYYQDKITVNVSKLDSEKKRLMGLIKNIEFAKDREEL